MMKFYGGMAPVRDGAPRRVYRPGGRSVSLSLAQDGGRTPGRPRGRSILLTAGHQLGLHHVTGQHREHGRADDGQPSSSSLIGEVQFSGAPGGPALRALIAQVG